MAKVTYNSGIVHLRGSIDGWVYKRYKDARGTVVSRVPDMSKVKPSAAQKAQRRRMGEAAKYYATVKADPALLKKFQAVAARKGLTLPAVVMAEALRKK